MHLWDQLFVVLWDQWAQWVLLRQMGLYHLWDPDRLWVLWVQSSHWVLWGQYLQWGQ